MSHLLGRRCLVGDRNAGLAADSAIMFYDVKGRPTVGLGFDPLRENRDVDASFKVSSHDAFRISADPVRGACL